jgi:hypothetical protein
MSAPIPGPFDPDENPEARDSSQEGPWRPSDGGAGSSRDEVDPNKTEESPQPDRENDDDAKGIANDGGANGGG